MQLRTIPQQSWWVFQLIYIISFRSNLWWSNNIYFLIYLFHSLCFWWVFHVPKKWCPTWSLIYPLVDAHSRCLLTMVWIIFWISGYYPEIKPCYLKKNFQLKLCCYIQIQFQTTLLNISIFYIYKFWGRKITKHIFL